MKQEDIIRMAQEAGFNRHHNPDLYDFMVASGKAIERFAALVAAAENEACKTACQAIAEHYELVADSRAESAADECASAIEARGQA